MIIHINKRAVVWHSSNSLLCCCELEGIEMNGGDDEDFWDEIF